MFDCFLTVLCRKVDEHLEKFSKQMHFQLMCFHVDKRWHTVIRLVRISLVTMCSKSSKPFQIGLCMLMSLSIHLHGLHLDTQYGQVKHDTCRHNYVVERGLVFGFCGQLLLPTPLSDSQVSISFVIQCLWWTASGQVKAHLLLTYANGVSPAVSPSCDCGQRQTMNHIVDTCPLA